MSARRDGQKIFASLPGNGDINNNLNMAPIGMEYDQSANATSRTSDGNMDPFGGGSTYEHDHHAMDIDGDEDEDLDAEESEDVFLPLTSPFPTNYSLNGSNHSSPLRRDTASPSGPSLFASQQMTAAERREHSRRHSRVHSRNLSVFFPRPEQKGLPGYQAQQDEGVPLNSTDSVAVPVAQTKGWGFANKEYSQPYRESLEEISGQTALPNSRRGHHHRHSISHKYEHPNFK